ncbi:MAG: hypothetical protein K1X94_26855 [Sandaracinaceae bacterium]|nr:hypothetical protein [Sandaracinaceae bacterium]
MSVGTDSARAGVVTRSCATPWVTTLGVATLGVAPLSVALSFVVGCGASAPPRSREVLIEAGATLPRATPHAGRTVSAPGQAARLVTGADAARAVLFELLDALVRDDPDAMRRLLAAETWSVHAVRLSRQVPRVLSASRREVVVQRLSSARRAGRLASDATPRDIVDPDGIEIVPARVYFADRIPQGLEPEDLLVWFPVEPQAERALLAVALHGRGVIVVRVAPDGALIVGL